MAATVYQIPGANAVTLISKNRKVQIPGSSFFQGPVTWKTTESLARASIKTVLGGARYQFKDFLTLTND